MDTKILQLRQEQIDIDFKSFKGLNVSGTGTPIGKEVEDRYIIIPTDIAILGVPGYENHNTLLQIAKAKGFTYLMLMYV